MSVRSNDICIYSGVNLKPFPFRATILLAHRFTCRNITMTARQDQQNDCGRQVSNGQRDQIMDSNRSDAAVREKKKDMLVLSGEREERSSWFLIRFVSLSLLMDWLCMF